MWACARFTSDLVADRGLCSDRTILAGVLRPFGRHGSGQLVILDGHGGATFYCAKYATKWGALFFSAGLERFRLRGHACPEVKLTLFRCRTRRGPVQNSHRTAKRRGTPSNGSSHSATQG